MNERDTFEQALQNYANAMFMHEGVAEARQQVLDLWSARAVAQAHEHAVIHGSQPPRCKCGATLYPKYPTGSEWASASAPAQHGGRGMTLRECMDAEDGGAEQHAQGWRAISEQPFPNDDDDTPYFVRNHAGYLGAATYVDNERTAFYDTAEQSIQICSGVTHWMPAPTVESKG